MKYYIVSLIFLLIAGCSEERPIPTEIFESYRSLSEKLDFEIEQGNDEYFLQYLPMLYYLEDEKESTIDDLARKYESKLERGDIRVDSKSLVCAFGYNGDFTFLESHKVTILKGGLNQEYEEERVLILKNGSWYVGTNVPSTFTPFRESKIVLDADSEKSKTKDRYYGRNVKLCLTKLKV